MVNVISKRCTIFAFQLKPRSAAPGECRKATEKESRESWDKSAINTYVEKGYAGEVKETDGQSKKVRYLLHHAVFRDTTSAQGEQGASLNVCILSWPALQSNLVSVLLRFWTGMIALMADVDKMFLQIKVDEKDQDVLRL